MVLAAVALFALPGAAPGQSPDTWVKLAPLPTARRLLAAAAEGGRVYTFGGCGSPCFNPPSHISAFEETRVEVYDPLRDRWEERDPLPEIFFGGAAAAPGNGRIYLVGGFLTADRLLEYDPAADRWQARRPLPTPRHGLAAVALGGEVYAIGGSDGQSASDRVEIYDPTTDTWRQGAPLPTPRVFLAAAAAGGKIFVVGGSPDCCGGSQTDAVEVYDPAADRWSAAAPLPLAEQTSAAVAIRGKVLVFGGFVPGAGVQGRTFELDPATGRWSERAPMPTPRDQAPAVAVGDVAFVPGGSVDCHCAALDVHVGYAPLTPEVAIAKDDGRDQVTTGDRVTYTVAVTNDGTASASPAVVRDLLPLDDVRWTCAGAGSGGCSSEGSGEIDDTVELPPGGRVTYTARGTVGASPSCPAPAVLTNTATVTPAGGQPLAAADVDARFLRADLAVAGTLADPGEAAGGDRITYTIEVTNAAGPDAACGALVRDDFAAGLTGVSWTCDPAGGATCGGSGSGVGPLADRVDLPPGGTVVYHVEATVAPLATCPQPTRLRNTATVAAPARVIDPNPDNDSATATIALVPSAELTVTDDDGRVAVEPGEPVTYTLTVDHAGGADAVCGALVRDTSRPQLADPTWSCEVANGATCGAGGDGPLLDQPVDLPPGGHIIYTVSGTAACGDRDTLANSVAVELPPGTPVAEAADVDGLACRADLSIHKSALASKVVAGSGAVFTLVVENHGPAAVHGAPVRDLLPRGLGVHDWSCSPAASCRPATGHGDVATEVDLAAGGSLTLDIDAEVDPDALCELVNSASVEPPQGVSDPDLTNNQDTAALTVFPPPPGIGACKTVAGPIVEGGVIVYTIVLLNPGPLPQADNPGDELVDDFPPQLTVLTASASSGTVAVAGNQVTWNGAIPVLETVTLTVRARIDDNTLGQTVCNQAVLSTDPDGDGVNDVQELSDDPALPGFEQETCFEVSPPLVIPTLSPLALALLAAALAAAAGLALRRLRS